MVPSGLSEKFSQLLNRNIFDKGLKSKPSALPSYSYFHNSVTKKGKNLLTFYPIIILLFP